VCLIDAIKTKVLHILSYAINFIIIRLSGQKVMSIYEYKEGDHKAGFTGWRVAVLVGDKYRQKYFNARGISKKTELDALEKQAKQINAEWNFERKLISNEKTLECKEVRNFASSIFNTGVSGIKMKFRIDTKFRAGETRKYYAPIFVVAGSTNNKRFFKVFSILTMGYDWAWMNAVQFYAEQKNMNHFSHLLERKPPVEKFIIIRRFVNSQGHDIPIKRLPDELEEYKSKELD